jgi:hypothetical protein
MSACGRRRQDAWRPARADNSRPLGLTLADRPTVPRRTSGAYSARTSRVGPFTVSPKRLPDEFEIVVTGTRSGEKAAARRRAALIRNQ